VHTGAGKIDWTSTYSIYCCTEPKSADHDWRQTLLSKKQRRAAKSDATETHKRVGRFDAGMACVEAKMCNLTPRTLHRLDRRGKA
jgi:hypothetical protein